MNQSDIKTIETYARHLTAWLMENPDDLIMRRNVVRLLKKAMPDAKGPIYRGLSVDMDRIDGMLHGEKIWLPNKGLESWTMDPIIALEFSFGTKIGDVGIIVSKKNPKKGTVVIDFTNKTVQEIIEKYAKDISRSLRLHVATYMQNEKELVTTPQCDTCQLRDLEVVIVDDVFDHGLFHTLKLDKFHKLSYPLYVDIQGKNKYTVFNRKNMDKISWRRKPRKDVP